MLKSNNVNIASRSLLSPPGSVRSELPLSLEAVMKVVEARQSVMNILDGADHRHMVIVGPCSIHAPEAAIEYAQRLRKLSEEVKDRIFILMRAYFEKPRTTVGWKGLIYDPDINKSYNIEKGIFQARKLLLKIVDLGLPVATEMLDPILAQYIADAVSWAAIGARTTESQTHRQLASGLSMPVGFKNATDGSFQTALDAISTARSPHSFIGVTEDGHVGVFRTKGNPYGHIVLRGGEHPNYMAEYIAFLTVAMRRNNLRPNIVIDCSHANSGKKYDRQHIAFHDVVEQVAAGERAIVGTMLESYLEPGAQKIVADEKPLPNISITDGCIGWEETEQLIRFAYDRLGDRN
ncbi:3-deoxy-7-phosphoheptulonate synthase [Victivallis sp. Marseille-Q1083]|uniref:3-deoxy-7-phosphoheptulonate synthase n=1 Tax=Victivallis sp. Marseille-Q1083 TaxID=2717288 RepID=UPI00158AEDD8|nr:3-deoxy-7-phosphoheptulonate synthase [Victivallis sp. Marseille-Q1083]